MRGDWARSSTRSGGAVATGKSRIETGVSAARVPFLVDSSSSAAARGGIASVVLDS